MREFFLSLKYARRELRAGLKGFYIFLACLVLGTAAIAGVQSLSRGLIDSLHHDGRFILGGDIALRTVYEPATPEQADFLRRKMRAVLSVVMETRAMARRTDGTRAALVELKAVDPFYPLYGRMEFADGAGKPLEGKVAQDMVFPVAHPLTDEKIVDRPGAAVEKELLSRLDLKVGDEIMLGKTRYLITGVITKEPDRLSGRGFALAPRVMISGYSVEEAGLAAQGAQVYYDHRLLVPLVRTLDDILAVQKQILEAFPDARWKGRNCYNAAPRAERMVRRLTQFLTLIALTALLVGGVGISNAVRSFLEAKTANVATLKCLGAPGKFVARVYMLVVLMLAALGVSAGLLIGALGARAAGAMLTAKLSLTNQVGIYPEALVLAAAFGFLTSFCFSLWPVARAALAAPNDLFRDTVQPSRRRPPFTVVLWMLIAAQALALLAVVTSEDRGLAAWFIGGAAVVFAVFFGYAALVKRVARGMRVPARPEWRMAVANLHRPGNVSASVILSLGLGLTVLAATALAQDNFMRILSEDLGPDTPSFFFLDVQPERKDEFAATITEHPTARNLIMTPSFRGRISTVNGKPAEEALVDRNEAWVISSDRGFTWAAKQPAKGEIVEGEWWPEDYSGPPLISIATDVAKAFDIGVGAELAVNIYGADVTAKVANVREIDWASFSMNFAVTFSPGLISQAPANMIATVAVAQEEEEPLQQVLSQRFPAVTIVRVREAMGTAQVFLRAISQAVALSAGVTLVGGILVLAGGIAAARRRHVYDSVVLKVLGATRGRILATFLLEYGMLGALTALIAGAFGTLAAWAVLTFVMEIRWSFSPGVLVGVLLLSLGMTVLAGFAGTWRVLLQKPAAYLRNQ